MPRQKDQKTQPKTRKRIKRRKRRRKKRRVGGKPGRPLKYAHIIAQLDPDTVYSSAMIAHFADFRGESRLVHSMRLNIRVSCNRLVQKRSFPKEGDGMVKLKGQAPTAGWKGSRWQEACDVNPVRFLIKSTSKTPERSSDTASFKKPFSFYVSRLLLDEQVFYTLDDIFKLFDFPKENRAAFLKEVKRCMENPRFAKKSRFTDDGLLCWKGKDWKRVLG